NGSSGKEWIKGEEKSGKFQIAAHPKDFFSSHILMTYLVSKGFSEYNAKDIIDRLEKFFYQAAFNGGDFSPTEESSKEIIKESIQSKKNEYLIAHLEAKSKVEELLALFKGRATLIDFKEAYLLDDYTELMEFLEIDSELNEEEEKNRLSGVVKNAMTRMLFNKTEIQHLDDIQSQISLGNYSKVIELLHTKRNYSLDSLTKSYESLDLLSEEGMSGKPLKKIQDLNQKKKSEFKHAQKFARGFLLFEEDFSHRCNSRQVEVFEGLLAEGNLDPKKLNAAQARMGFGKTSLLPLIALLKADGKRLIRFIVPSSALETNTSDLSKSLIKILNKRAVKDNFSRYHLAPDKAGPEEVVKGQKVVGKNLRLASIEDIRGDLQSRLELYQQVQKKKMVLTQAPHVRNSIENQLKIFLKLLPSLGKEQKRALIQCINLLNIIRSMQTVSIFDELDATQDPLTTDVNFTSGKKITLDREEILPIEKIIKQVSEHPNLKREEQAEAMLEIFFSKEISANTKKREAFKDYMLSAKNKAPAGNISKELLLCKALLSDDKMFSLLLDKKPNTDFGVWFKVNNKDKTKSYDLQATNPEMKPPLKSPLLVAIPYRAANEPKPQGSRFDNPEVTVVATLRYYQDSTTEIKADPHLDFLIEVLKEGLESGGLEEFFKDEDGDFFKAGKSSPFSLYEKIQELSGIEDYATRIEERDKLFEILKGDLSGFRKCLGRCIVAKQVTYDSGKANSNRNEQGNLNNELIGFSGTSGDTSSSFERNLLDPAADGNMTLGIMGREDCQQCIALDMSDDTKGLSGKESTRLLIKRIWEAFKGKHSVEIDSGGLFQASNEEVTEFLFEENNKVKGIIFYDVANNTKKIMLPNKESQEGYKIEDLTKAMEKESDLKGSYITYFDQSHSRGADIPQKKGASAAITMSLGVKNSDHKQSIMRLRKIIDQNLGQNFSLVLLENEKKRIAKEIGLEEEGDLTGNDIAFYLRKKELEEGGDDTPGMIKGEIEAIIKNAFLQQQAKACALLFEKENEFPEEGLINKFSTFIADAEEKLKIDLIEEAQDSLMAKYGGVLEEKEKEQFLAELKSNFEERLIELNQVLEEFAKEISGDPSLLSMTDHDNLAYQNAGKGVIKRRGEQLPDRFEMKKGDALSMSEVQSEAQAEDMSEAQSENQSNSEAKTHSFSQVQKEDSAVTASLNLLDRKYKEADISFLDSDLGKLTRAVSVPHYTNLFTSASKVVCSPKYMEKATLARTGEDAISSLRYLLINQMGVHVLHLKEQKRLKFWLKNDRCALYFDPQRALIANLSKYPVKKPNKLLKALYDKKEGFLTPNLISVAKGFGVSPLNYRNPSVFSPSLKAFVRKSLNETKESLESIFTIDEIPEKITHFDLNFSRRETQKARHFVQDNFEENFLNLQNINPLVQEEHLKEILKKLYQ
ncbi:hypothetical protein AB751O23_CC_00010, partial [Chlamydiales bacterium SCGC AB-751-O23]